MDSISKLLLAFVTLIVGIVLIGSIATSVLGVSSGINVINETQSLSAALATDGTGTAVVNTTYPLRVTNYPTGWKSDDCPLTGVAIKNATNSALTSGTHYTFYPANGSWNLKGATVNTTFFTANNNSYVSYTYCGDDYMNLSWGRTVLSVAVGLFALGLLMTSVGLFYSIAKDAGLV